MRSLTIFFDGPFLFLASAMIGALVFYIQDTIDRREWIVVALGTIAIWVRADVRGDILAELSIAGGFTWVTAFTVTLAAPFVRPNQVPRRITTLRRMAGPPTVLFLVTL